MDINQARQVALDNLCIHDKQSSYYNAPYDDDDIIEPRKNCYCDSCFYGKDDLALIILNLIKDKTK